MLDINYNSQVTRNAPEADIPIYNILDTNLIEKTNYNDGLYSYSINVKEAQLTINK